MEYAEIATMVKEGFTENEVTAFKTNAYMVLPLSILNIIPSELKKDHYYLTKDKHTPWSLKYCSKDGTVMDVNLINYPPMNQLLAALPQTIAATQLNLLIKLVIENCMLQMLGWLNEWKNHPQFKEIHMIQNKAHLCDSENVSWLTLASDIKNSLLVRELLQNKADPNIQTKSALVTPLHNAVSQDDVKSVQQLVTSKANPNIQNHLGRTAFHNAVIKKVTPEIYIMLLSACADLTLKDNDGDNCLHHAVREGNVEGVRIIVSRSVDATVVNGDSKSSFDIAIEMLAKEEEERNEVRANLYRDILRLMLQSLTVKEQQGRLFGSNDPNKRAGDEIKRAEKTKINKQEPSIW